MLHVGQSGNLVEVAMSSDEEIQRQRELGEGAPGSAEHDRLVIDLESAASTLPCEANCVPRVQRHLANASVLAVADTVSVTYLQFHLTFILINIRWFFSITGQRRVS